MKKYFISLLLLFMSTICYAAEKRIIPVYVHIPVVDKYITHEETKTNYVKEFDYQGVKFSVVGNTITLKSDSFTLDVKTTIKKAVAVPVKIVE